MAQKSKLIIGTSGWSYPSGPGKWTGVVFERGQDELVQYAEMFKFVEVNSTFYRVPEPNIIKSWIKKTPDDFQFAIKLWQKFTHPKMYAEMTEQTPELKTRDVDLVKKSLDPLQKKGKMGPLLIQFPPSFKDSEESRDRLSDIISDFKDFDKAIEVRHRSWTDSEFLKNFFEDQQISWVTIDEPKFSTSVGRTPQTGNFSYFRLHGRNSKDWWNKASREKRFNYLYSIDELTEILQNIKDIEKPDQVIYVAFNNHPAGKAIINGLQMMDLNGGKINKDKLEQIKNKQKDNLFSDKL